MISEIKSSEITNFASGSEIIYENDGSDKTSRGDTDSDEGIVEGVLGYDREV